MMLPPPASLLAHGPDAVLLDVIESAGPGRLAASLTVRSGTPFSLEDGSLASWAGPELMAQAVSAFAELEAGPRTSPSIGLLLGVRGYRALAGDFAPGTRLSIEVAESTRDEDGRGVFNCRILQAGEVAAEGRLTVFRPDDPWKVLAEQLP